jgi:hypothetical protein
MASTRTTISPEDALAIVEQYEEAKAERARDERIRKEGRLEKDEVFRYIGVNEHHVMELGSYHSEDICRGRKPRELQRRYLVMRGMLIGLHRGDVRPPASMWEPVREDEL